MEEIKGLGFKENPLFAACVNTILTDGTKNNELGAKAPDRFIPSASRETFGSQRSFYYAKISAFIHFKAGNV
jgi:hypothetical protein